MVIALVKPYTVAECTQMSLLCEVCNDSKSCCGFRRDMLHTFHYPFFVKLSTSYFVNLGKNLSLN